jgi:tRNA threonylcarbamoyl adenosine modification protein YeaZ
LPETDGPLILAFDTSAAHCAAALLCGDRVLASVVEPMAKGQAERLMGLCDALMASANVAFTDLDAIGVGIGPGNFTGIRISVSAARGLALGLGVPAIGINTLEAQAFGIEGPVVSTVDARRETVYAQVFDGSPCSDPVICSLDDLPRDALRPGITCVGHANDRIAAIVGGEVHAPQMPIAEAIARLASLRIGTETSRPAPLYLRSADAAPARDAPPVILP